MAIVIAVALVPASAVLGPASSGARPPACRQESVTVPEVDGPAIPQALEQPVSLHSLGHIAFDRPSAKGAAGRLARLRDNSN